MINFKNKESLASLSGRLFFSKTQYNSHREEGRDRMFAKLQDGKGTIVEYTELISFEMIAEEEIQIPLETDAVFIGNGTFDYFADEQGREFK